LCTTGGVQLYFSISLHEKDRKLLEQIKIYFGPGGGQIYKHGEKSIQYRVLSIKDMPVIISHFYLYPLMSKKSVTYKLFKLAFNLFINKEHLTMKGLEKIVAIKNSMNCGISPASFNSLSVTNTLLKLDNSDLIEKKTFQILSGLLNLFKGEGCFYIQIQKSSTINTGYSVN